MASPVPPQRPSLTGGNIGAGRPVRSFDWQSGAALANYIRGRGSVLVPRTTIIETIAIAATGTYRFRVRPNQFAKRRVWMLELLSATTGVSTSCSVSVNGGTAVTVTASGSRAQIVPIEVFETLGSPDQIEAEINVAITASATGAVTVMAIAVAEVPMASLSQPVDGGEDLGRVAPLAPVDVYSLGLVAYDTSNAMVGAINAGRRVGMHHFALRTEGTGITSTSTVYVPLYTAGCEAPQLGRFLYTGDTTRALTFKCYGKITGGATFSLRVTMTSGASTVITTTSAAAGWFGASNTIAVDAEDLTTADGRRAARWDVAAIEYKSSSGAQTLSLWSVSIWEDLAP